MLVRLGRWLRAAGYDTSIAREGMSDLEIFQEAQRDHRLIITRDHHFLEMDKGSGLVVWLSGNGVEECVRELSQKNSLNWLFDPFSRCLVCNHIFQEPTISALEQVPEKVRSECKVFWYCPECDQVFWEGSHTKRMREQLKLWQEKK